jgi:hypothetical protein
MSKFIFILLFSFNTLAQVAVPIKQGEKSSISGVVITEDKAKELYKAEQSNITLRELRIADKELSEHYKYLAKDSQEKLNKAKFEAYWSGSIGLLVGIGISLFTFKVIQEGTR